MKLSLINENNAEDDELLKNLDNLQRLREKNLPSDDPRISDWDLLKIKDPSIFELEFQGQKSSYYKTDINGLRKALEGKTILSIKKMPWPSDPGEATWRIDAKEWPQYLYIHRLPSL